MHGELGGVENEIGRLREEIAALRASRERLALATDAERSRMERRLHDGVQQRLVALAVAVQLAEKVVDSDPADAKALLADMGRDVEQALDEASFLADRMYPPLLDAAGLAAALRAAAVRAQMPATIEVAATPAYPAHIARTVYWCWLEILVQATGRPAITVREQDGELVFVADRDGPLSDAGPDWLRERVEALGGRLSADARDGGLRLCGWLPLAP